jgi:hypothetical protein
MSFSDNNKSLGSDGVANPVGGTSLYSSSSSTRVTGTNTALPQVALPVSPEEYYGIEYSAVATTRLTAAPYRYILFDFPDTVK